MNRLSLSADCSRSRRMKGAPFYLSELVLLMAVSCSQEGDESPNDADPSDGAGANSSIPGAGGGDSMGTGGAGDGTGASSSGGTNGTDPEPPTPVDNLPTIRPTRIRIADPVISSPPCAQNGSGSIVGATTLIGQTHVLAPDHPFLVTTADRPLTIAVAATGSGDAPSMAVTATVDGVEQGTVCLTGPSALPGATTDLDAATYRATLPAAWVQPDLHLSVAVGSEAPEELDVDVSPANGITLYLMDAMLFGEGELEPYSEDLMREFLSRLPVSYLDVGHNPLGIWAPTQLLVENRDDGRSPTGEQLAHGPLIATEYPYCDDADRMAGTCTAHSGFAMMSSVLQSLSTFTIANGLTDAATWYADLSVGLGGGLGGGFRGTGDEPILTLNHELGHAWGFPHWDTNNTEYPYEGELANWGGVGDAWALDQTSGALWSPQCGADERQSPMQRRGDCVPTGANYDPFSDYESARIHRGVFGGDEIAGMVSYGGNQVPFTLRQESGRQQLVWNDGTTGVTFLRFNQTTGAFEEAPPERPPVEETEIPVMMFHGGAIRQGDSYVLEPIEYIGNTLDLLDPTVQEDFDQLSELYWAHDLSVRFTLDDDSVVHQVLRGRADYPFRDEGAHAWFAINVPREFGARVVKFELLSRPLGQFDPSSALTPADTPQNFYDAAEVAASWERP